MLVLTCVLVVAAVSGVMSANILAVLPSIGRSHFIFSNSVLTALAARGHQVTVYAPYLPSKPIANMRHVEVHTNFEKTIMKSITYESFMQFSQQSFFGGGAHTFWQMTYPMCEEFLSHEKIKELLVSKEKFDLVMLEALFGQESLLVFGHLMNAPVINLNSFGPWTIVNRVHGNSLQIASMPETISFPFSAKMSMVERFKNLVSTVNSLLYYHFRHLPLSQGIIERTLKDSKFPPLEEMVTNITITLANFHSTAGYSQPIPGNIVSIGGIQIAQELPPLPKDIKDFLDGGKNAVIYFSLGSLVPVHVLPPEILQTFVNVFKKLPYKVLWKIEADTVPDLPRNVMIAKWVPQQSVLAHPNCVLFITHGGLLSQQESFHAGVPVIGIPFFADQPSNVRLYEELGVGVGLDFSSLSEDSLYKAIMSVVGKPQFIENAKKLSTIFRHRPLAPADTVVFWTEYVLRHGGAHHLRPQAAVMPWYSLFMLDVLAVIILITVIVLLVIIKLLSLVCGGSKKSESVSSKKKKN